MTITVFTDGACSGNPGPGGWGWAVKDGPYGSGCEKQTTNQRMEVMAVLDALQTFLSRDDTDDVEIVSDSTYVVNCFRDSWWRGWESRGWKNSQKQPVANQDLWKPLVALYKQNQSRVAFRWVKGHSGNPMNDLVDQLAVAAGKAQTPRRVVGLEPEPAFVPAANPASLQAVNAATKPDTSPQRLTESETSPEPSEQAGELRLFDI